MRPPPMENVKLANSASKQRLKVGLVGGETLLGKELEQVVGDRGSALIVSFAATGEGNFGEVDGEAVYVEPLEAQAVADARAVLIAGTAEGALKAYDLAKAGGGRPLIIDCTGYLEGQPEARIVTPLVSDVEIGQNWLLEVAHPAASALVLTMKRLARYRKLRMVLAEIFEPASEQGKRGVTELHKQTTNLLSFKPAVQSVFDAQLSFNLLAQYGEEGAAKLAAVEQRIDRHVATLLSSGNDNGAVPIPSLRVIGAPVFHGYSLSIWAEFESEVNAREIEEALASAQIEVRSEGEEVPTSVGVASQSGLIAGDIRIDRNNPRAAWIWVVADNLRLTADAAAELISQLDAKTK